MSVNFTLGQNVCNTEESVGMIKVLLSETYTMGKEVYEFEQQFATAMGSEYAVMVNSGSSANLLAMAVATNYKRKCQLKPGDKILVSSVCWSTSVFPIIQMGLIPVFVDTDPVSVNMNLDDFERKITSDTKGVVLVHALGNCTDMNRFMKLVEQHNLFVMEDTCESLGTTYNKQYLGTFGDFGTYSFYYSHHITTIEGGMVICKTKEDYELLKCLRAHGWTRNLVNKSELHATYSNVDERFTFVNLGYNFRPTEMQGSMGKIQLGKLETKNNNRLLNYNAIKQQIVNDTRNRGYLSFPETTKHARSVWFGIAMYLNTNIKIKEYLKYLSAQRIENRPIITGNMVRQPVMLDLYPELNPLDFPGSEFIHNNGFFIGLPCEPMTSVEVSSLVNVLLGYSEFTEKYDKKILVTGGSGCVGSALQNVVAQDIDNKYVFLSSKDCDLRNRTAVFELFERLKPDYIVHLAARVVGMYKNLKDSATAFSDNIKINENVLEACQNYGVKQGIFCLSAGMFTDTPSKYPLDETMIFEGEPSTAIKGYAYSKRMLAMQCENYNKQYGTKYLCITPCNLYGPNDRFDLETAHLVPALIHKFYMAVKNSEDITIFGSGRPVKQLMYSYDLARIIHYLLFNMPTVENVICTNETEISIKDLVDTVAQIADFKGHIAFDSTKSDGCLRRTMSNATLKTIMPDFEFTPLQIGLEHTWKWFASNYNFDK